METTSKHPPRNLSIFKSTARNEVKICLKIEILLIEFAEEYTTYILLIRRIYYLVKLLNKGFFVMKRRKNYNIVIKIEKKEKKKKQ